MRNLLKGVGQIVEWSVRDESYTQMQDVGYSEPYGRTPRI